MGGGVVFTHGAQDQPGAGVFQPGPDRGDQQHRQIDHRIVLKQDRADHRDIGEHRQVHLAHRRRFHPGIGLARQRRQAEAEQGERKAGGDLVRFQKLGDHAEDQAQPRTGKGGGGEAEHRVADVHRRGKADHRAGDHHALDAKVEHARLFGDHFAESGQQDRGRGDHQGRDQQDRVDLAKVHHATSLWPMRTR